MILPILIAMAGMMLVIETLKIHPIYFLLPSLTVALLSDIIIPYTTWIGIDSTKIILGSGKIFPRIRKIISIEGIESILKLPWHSLSTNVQLIMKSGEKINIGISKEGFDVISELYIKNHVKIV